MRHEQKRHAISRRHRPAHHDAMFVTGRFVEAVRVDEDAGRAVQQRDRDSGVSRVVDVVGHGSYRTSPH